VPNTVYFIDTPLGTVKGNQAHSILYHTSAIYSVGVLVVVSINSFCRLCGYANRWWQATIFM